LLKIELELSSVKVKYKVHHYRHKSVMTLCIGFVTIILEVPP
jgi:hypothetical protein